MLPRRKGYHRHHVIPKWKGGGDEDTNIIYVTLEEHIQIHEERYRLCGHDQDKRAVILLRNEMHPNVLRQQTQKEHLSRIAKIGHETKLKNGFYAKLGKLNSERLKGKSNPGHTERMKEEWKKNPRKWWTDGSKSIRSVECPGSEWRPGRPINRARS